MGVLFLDIQNMYGRDAPWRDPVPLELFAGTRVVLLVLSLVLGLILGVDLGLIFVLSLTLAVVLLVLHDGSFLRVIALDGR